MEVNRSSVASLMFLYLCSSLALDSEYKHSECFQQQNGESLHSHTLNDIHGRTVNFKNYKGYVTLVVNVASFWDLTNTTYTQLNAIHKKYESIQSIDKNGQQTDRCSFKILGFPCNQFGHQEPGKEYEILNCLKHVRPGGGFKANFKLFSKVNVNGKDSTPLFKWLRHSCPKPISEISLKSTVLWSPIEVTDITWNFEKFLIDENGLPIRRFSEFTHPLNFESDIKMAMEDCKTRFSLGNTFGRL